MLRTLLALLTLTTAAFLTSCHTSHKTAGKASPYRYSTAKTKADPKFLEDISLNGSQHNVAVKSGIAHKKGNSKYDLKPVSQLQAKYAGMLNVEATAITNLSLYTFIDDWMGVRYKYGGNDKNGIDCSAFVQKVYENVFCTNVVRTAFEQFNFCKLIFQSEILHEGDLVFFRIRRKKISHVGIYLANNFFVHASSSQGVTISSLSDPYWQKYFAGAGEMPRS